MTYRIIRRQHLRAPLPAPATAMLVAISQVGGGAS